MAKPWGNVDTEETLLPNWFKDTNVVDDSNNVTQKNVDRPHQTNSNQEIAASDRGWEKVATYVDSGGNIRKKSEVLVAQGKLATTFVKPVIVDATFDVGAVAAGATVRVNVQFSEDVKVDGDAPTLKIQYSDDDFSSDLNDRTCTYNGSSGQSFANNTISFVSAALPGGAAAGEKIRIKPASPITDFGSIKGVTTDTAMVTENITAALTDDQQITLT